MALGRANVTLTESSALAEAESLRSDAVANALLEASVSTGLNATELNTLEWTAVVSAHPSDKTLIDIARPSGLAVE